MNPTPPNGPAEDDQQAEQHVSELMGPPQQIDGTHSYEDTPMMVPTSLPKPTVPPPDEIVSPDTAPDIAREQPVSTAEAAPAVSTAAESTEKPGSSEETILVPPPVTTPADQGVEPVSEIPTTVPAETPVVMKLSIWGRAKEAYFRWWDNRTKRYITLGVVAVIIGVVIGVPAVRYTLMNLIGIRTSVSVTALDQTTLMPLEHVVLQAGTIQTKTGEDGKAKLRGVKLGRQAVTVRKAGFADVTRQITFGMRTVDLGEVEMKATGLQYSVTFTDFLSGKPIGAVDVTSGEASAKSDKKGLAVITLPTNGGDDVLTVTKTGYRTESLKVSADKTTLTTTLVPAQKEVFVEKSDGVYSVFKMDIDGTHRQELLVGTGLETPDITLSVDPAGKRAALVSTRDEKRNADGYLLQALTLIDISTGASETIEHAEDIDVVGWQGATLVYQQTVAGASAANPSRQKLIAYDYEAAKRYQIAAANSFIDEVLFGGNLYYIVSSTDPSVNGGLVRAGLDGSGKKTLYNDTLWAMNRIDYKTLRLQLPDTWYSYALGSSSADASATTMPTTAREYLDSPDGKLSVWRDMLQGGASITVYDVASGKDTNISTSAPVHRITRWVGNRVVMYQTVSGNTVTDWAVSLDGGEPRELTVTAVSAAR